MPIFELFSKRQKKLRGEISDVYKYEEVPSKLRVQIVHIITDTIGSGESYNSRSNSVYETIHKTLCREYGVFNLNKNAESYYTAIYDSFLQEKDYEKCLDIIEISFKMIDTNIRNNPHQFQFNSSVSLNSDQAISELNTRFKESNIGYQFESSELVRVDSQFLHIETVKPVLKILGSNKQYSGANDEFLAAHEHYRNKRYKECLNDCLKSLESLMKAIHDKNKWPYKSGDTAKKLIASSLSNGLIPEYLQNQFSAIKTVIESGVPTVRNKHGGHGQGSEISEVPEHLASYTLHLTATNLLFLANCEDNN
ncbi:STM4504/CBY_0614 family protein [Moritella viscosa]|uniref:STM4504/CBY_0614 family protein n=1 Tax=Moritella viscosa TaxID=80854 RepID=UPI0009154754|nr:hypothetical protein [Moritella viscosa]SGZ09080.1 Putative uncharacterized protein [Moritella viscosa]